MSTTIIYGIISGAFLTGLCIIMYLMFRSDPKQEKPKDSEEQSDGLLVAMHTYFKAAGELKKANEIAGELKRRGYRDDSSENSEIGIWNKK